MINNNTLATARILHYKPRGTNYCVLHHNVHIKVRNTGGFDWESGCVYQDTITNNIYTRPYSQFDLSKWVLVD